MLSSETKTHVFHMCVHATLRLSNLATFLARNVYLLSRIICGSRQMLKVIFEVVAENVTFVAPEVVAVPLVGVEVDLCRKRFVATVKRAQEGV